MLETAASSDEFATLMFWHLAVERLNNGGPPLANYELALVLLNQQAKQTNNKQTNVIISVFVIEMLCSFEIVGGTFLLRCCVEGVFETVGDDVVFNCLFV
jgi:hypothetical protein